jgi:hypothetical protein
MKRTLAVSFALAALASPSMAVGPEADRAAILATVAQMETNTRLFRKVKGKWLITVNHVSAYDLPQRPTAREAN